jgi:hypothetical protein
MNRNLASVIFGGYGTSSTGTVRVFPVGCACSVT